jgi:uncharacterized protein (TIGR02996 family)
MSVTEQTFLAALHAEPNDEATWLALADWLEDDGQPERAELVRLLRRLCTLPVMKRRRERARLEDRVAELLAAGVRPVVAELVNSIGMRLALIPPGRFRMGSPADELYHSDDEGPLHEVHITRPFYIGIFPVTQAEYQRVAGRTPAFFCRSGDGRERVAGLDTRDFPIEQVSWANAVAFCKALSALKSEKAASRTYRLPTEAEWEYACRGGTASSGPFPFGSSFSSDQANFDGTCPYGDAAPGPYLWRTTRVGSYPPNAFGLYDMHGNVWEWCLDWFGESYYRKSPRKDPQGPRRGEWRVMRGGCYVNNYDLCRAGCRGSGFLPDTLHEWSGFRVVCVGGGPS